MARFPARRIPAGSPLALPRGRAGTGLAVRDAGSGEDRPLAALLRGTDTRAFVVVHDGRVAPFDGDLDDYRTFVLDERRRAQRAEAAGGPKRLETAVDRKEQKRQEAVARQQRADACKPYVTRQSAIEAELAAASN